MNQGRFALPAAVGKLLSLLPVYPGSAIFVIGLNLAIAKHLPSDVQDSLNGKKFRIRVVDAQLAFDFEWRNGAFVACRNNGEADLTIAASAHDFLLLAQRQEDPDTLFFSRRLAMDGDTELGLLVKNTLDAIDGPVFDLGRLAPDRVFSRHKRAPNT
jgi:predicted lipid carrier protein YhbT